LLFRSAGAALSSDYVFRPQSPGVTLGIGSNTITLAPCPLGVNGTDANHYLYFSAGTGSAEAALITGGTCTSGASSGTVIVAIANNHSGAWTVQSASDGIREALSAGIDSAGRGSVRVTGGLHTIHGTLYVPPNHSFHLQVDGELLFPDLGSPDGIWIDSSRASTFDFNAQVNYAGAGNAVKFYGLGPDPQDAINQIDGCQFHFTNVQGITNEWTSPAAVRIFYFLSASNHIGYGNYSHNIVTAASLLGGQYLLVTEGSATSGGWGLSQENTFTITQMVGFTQIGLLSGYNPAGFVNANNNTFNVNVIWPGDVTSGAVCLAIEEGSNANTFNVNNVSCTGQTAIRISNPVASCVVNVASYQGTAVDNNAYSNGNYLNAPARQQFYPVTVGASPFMYVNRDLQDEFITWGGGSGVSVAMTFAPGATGGIGLNMPSGIIPVPNDATVTFTYTTPPTIFKISKALNY
jgi:hypothetical protein